MRDMSVIKRWLPCDRPLSNSELNYRHRAQVPSDWELDDGFRANRHVVQLLQIDAAKDECSAVCAGERRREDAGKGASAPWFGIPLGCGESVQLQAEPSLEPQPTHQYE